MHASVLVPDKSIVVFNDLSGSFVVGIAAYRTATITSGGNPGTFPFIVKICLDTFYQISFGTVPVFRIVTEGSDFFPRPEETGQFFGGFVQEKSTGGRDLPGPGGCLIP